MENENEYDLAYQNMLNKLYKTPKHKLSDDENLMDKITRVVNDFSQINETELLEMKSLIENSEFKNNLKNHLKSIEFALKQKGYDY
jgi:hypothetical protein